MFNYSMNSYLSSLYIALNITMLISVQYSNFLKLQHIGDFNYARLADFGAAISGANPLQCQQVLEELDVSSCGSRR